MPVDTKEVHSDKTRNFTLFPDDVKGAVNGSALEYLHVVETELEHVALHFTVAAAYLHSDSYILFCQNFLIVTERFFVRKTSPCLWSFTSLILEMNSIEGTCLGMGNKNLFSISSI